MASHFVTAIILAAGSGTRMNTDVTKQQMLLDGESILSRTLAVFNSCEINDIILVTRESEFDFAESLSKLFDKVNKIVFGGKNRAESAKNGFLSLSPECEYVLFHDAARCFINKQDIIRTVNDAFLYGAATASTKVTDTIKEVDDGNFIKFTHNRKSLRAVQTPQVFSVPLYKKAIEEVGLLDEDITDDNMLLEKIGIPVFCSDTSAENFKITNQMDFNYAEYLLKGNHNE